MALIVPGNVSVEQVAPEIMAHLGWVRRDSQEGV